MKFVFYAIFIFIPLSMNVIIGKNLILNVTHIKSNKGNLMIYLWNHPDVFLKKRQATYHACIDLTTAQHDLVNGQYTVNITNLESGMYAIMVFHDENKSYHLENNFLGIPMEGFAFGNNLRPKLGPPTFHDAAIDITHTDVIHELKLTY